MLETGEAKSIHCREEGGERLRLRAVGTLSDVRPVSTVRGTFSPLARREVSRSAAPELNQHMHRQLLNTHLLTSGSSVAHN